MGPYMSASFATCVLLTAWSSTTRGHVYQSTDGFVAGCGIQYEPGQELKRVVDPRIQTIFRRLLARFGITEPVLLCADIPLGERNFAETVRRSDGRAVISISNALLEFTDAEVMGLSLIHI